MIVTNKVIIVGNLVRDNEYKVAGSTNILNNCIAVKREFKKGESDFINITAFGKVAELMNTYTKKGSKILIEGRINVENYKDKDDNPRTSTKVIVNNVEFLGTKEVKDDLLGDPVFGEDQPF